MVTPFLWSRITCATNEWDSSARGRWRRRSRAACWRPNFSAGGAGGFRRGRAAAAALQELGIRATERNLEIVPECDVLLVAVKPQNLDEVLREIGPALRKEHLLITICAGCATALFESAANEPVRVVRAMPNLPVRVRMGATALCAGRYATQADLELAHEIFGAVGHVVVVDERLMDAVTALSGSGPAYFDFLIEAMVEAGRAKGFPSRSRARWPSRPRTAPPR